MEERPVAAVLILAVLILASVIALGHAAPFPSDYRQRQDNSRLSRFSSNPYLSHRSFQPRLHRFFSHPSPPPPPPPSPSSSRPFRRWPPQRPAGRDSKRLRPPPPKRAKPPPPRLKPFHSAYLRQPVGRRYGGGGGRKVNVEMKIGFLFVGVVVLLQVAFGVFLGVRRWQISKLERRAS